MSAVRYLTDLSEVVVPRRVRLSDAVEVTHHPLESGPDGPGFAHLSYRTALAVAAANGARLLTTAEILALHLVATVAGTEIGPCILPTAIMRASGCVPGDGRMVTREWCEIHDSIVLERIASIEALGSGTGDAPFANIGKLWRAGAPSGRAGLCGWWVANVAPYTIGADGKPRRTGPGFIQEGHDWPHDDEHADYGTLAMLAWDIGETT